MKASELLKQSAEPFDKACMLVFDLEKQVESLIEENARLREEREWIDVKDRLPEDINKEVWVWDGDNISTDYCYIERWVRRGITHWQPINKPKPPTKGD